MGVKRLALLSLYLKVRAPTVEGEFYTIKNPFTLFRKSGSITLSNGYSLEFNKENKKRILGLANFCLKTGIIVNYLHYYTLIQEFTLPAFGKCQFS